MLQSLSAVLSHDSLQETASHETPLELEAAASYEHLFEPTVQSKDDLWDGLSNLDLSLNFATAF